MPGEISWMTYMVNQLKSLLYAIARAFLVKNPKLRPEGEFLLNFGRILDEFWPNLEVKNHALFCGCKWGEIRVVTRCVFVGTKPAKNSPQLSSRFILSLGRIFALLFLPFRRIFQNYKKRLFFAISSFL